MKGIKNHYLFQAGISCFFYLGYGSFTVIQAIYCQDVGMSASQISYIVSFAPLLSIATQPFFGYLSDKWRSPRKVSMMLLGIIAICTFIFSITRSFWLLLLTSGLAVSLWSAVMPLADLIAASAPYDFGKIRLWGSVGYAFMAQISGILYEYISPFSNYIASILGTILTIICVYYVFDPKIDDTKESKSNLSTKVIMKELIHNRPYIIFLIISFFFWGASMTNYNYLSLFILSQGGTSTQVGTYQLFSTLFEIPMILATDYITKKVPFRYILMFAIGMGIFNFAWYASLPSVNWIIYMFIFKGFSTVLYTMITVKLIMLMVKDEYVSTAYGIQCMIGKGIGVTIVQLIGGRLIDTVSMSGFYIFLACMVVISFICTFFFTLPQNRD